MEILDWLKKAGIPEKDFKHHVVVVSAKPDAAEQFGLPKENFFPIWDWVGGRFSVWGAIGLPVAIALGADTFKRFWPAPMQWTSTPRSLRCTNNLPALMAMFAYWNSEKLDVSSYCFLPYDERLRVMVVLAPAAGNGELR